MKISFIIPVYNSAEYLTACLNSIVPFLRMGHEAIIMNDGSTDNSQDILDSFASNHSNIILLKQENAGQSAARNVCLQYASGDYVCYVDSDDTLDFEPFSKVIESASSCEYDAVCFGLYLDYADKSITTPLMRNKEYADGVSYFYGSVADYTFKTFPVNKLFRRSILIENNIKFSEGRIYEDMLFNLQFFMFAGAIKCLEYYPYRYNLSNTGSSTSPARMKDLDCIYMIDKAGSFLDSGNYAIKSDNKYFLIMIFTFVSSCILKKYVQLYSENSLAKDILKATFSNKLFRRSSLCTFKSSDIDLRRRVLAGLAYFSPRLYIFIVSSILKHT